jgi:hypothetical protein
LQTEEGTVEERAFGEEAPGSRISVDEMLQLRLGLVFMFIHRILTITILNIILRITSEDDQE